MLRSRRVFQKVNQLVLRKPKLVVKQPAIRLFSEKNDNGPTPPPKGEEKAQKGTTEEAPVEEAPVEEVPAEIDPAEATPSVEAAPAEKAAQSGEKGPKQKGPRKPREQKAQGNKSKAPAMRHGYSEKQIIRARQQDNRSLDLNQYLYAQKAVPIMQIDVFKAKTELKDQIKKEKDEFLKKLNAQEKLIKKDVNMRVFANVEELKAIQEQEQALLDMPEANSPEAKFALDQKRKELLVKKSNLKVAHEWADLIDLVDRFPRLKEAEKRDAFVSLSLAHQKELATIQLLSTEVSSGNKIRDARVHAKVLEDLLKQIMPREKTFDSLAEIQQKKANIDKIFDDATQQVEDRMLKIEEAQALLKNLDSKSAQETFYKGFIEQKQLSQKEFAEKVKQIQDYKSAIEAATEEELQTLRDRKSSSMQAQDKAEFEAQQMRNLLLLISKSQSDLGYRMRQIQYNHKKRNEFIHNKEKGPDDKLKFKFDGHQKQDNFREFMGKLKQYDVCPHWLNDQQYGLLAKRMEQENEQIFMQALQLEQDVLMQEAQHLIGLIHNKTDTYELKAHLLGQLRIQAASIGAQDDKLTQLLMGSLEAKLIQNDDFYPTELLMELIEKDQAQKPSQPNRSVFDEMTKNSRKWQPANLEDQQPEETLTYSDYRYRQLKELQSQEESVPRRNEQVDENTEKLREYKLMDEMTNIKREAWLYIYNKWIKGGQQEQGQAFYELFRDYENKLPKVEVSQVKQIQSVDWDNVYDPASMSTEELEKEELRQAIVEAEKGLDETMRKLHGAGNEKRVDQMSEAQQEVLNENYKAIHAAKEEFKVEYGHDYTEGVKDQVPEIKGVQGVGIIPHMKDGRIEYKAIKDMQFISDQLVRKITNHLREPALRFHRISDQIPGVKDVNENDQVFDVKGYEKMMEFDGLSTEMQQQKLQNDLRAKQESIQRSLEMRNNRLAQMLGKETKKAKQDPVSEEEVNEQLDQVESLVRQKLADEDIKLSNDPVQQVMRKIGAEQKEIAKLQSSGPLKDFIEQDKFGVHNQQDQEEARIQELVQSNKEFDLAFIVGPNFAREVKYSGEAGVDTASQMVSAQSSAQIKEAASTQNLSAEDQKLASLFNPLSQSREEKLRQRYQYYVNLKMKEQFAQQILAAQEYFEEVNYQRERFLAASEHKIRKFASDVAPVKIYDFIEQEILNSQPVNKSAMIVDRLNKFDPQSKDVQNYNDELRFQLELKGEEFETQFNYILQQMETNGIKYDSQTRALLFSKNVFDNNLDQATINLKKLVENEAVYSHSQAKVSDLSQFFESSLAKDNFDGLAHLANYIDKHKIDISSWEISRFRSAIDFYLNHSFDINKILTFSKFYTQYAQSKLQHSQEFTEVFGELESLVDMNALFAYLVDKVGTKTFVDPVTKQDPLQSLMEFFAQKEVQEICQMSQEGTTFISSGDIARYFQNHLDSPGSFKKTADIILMYQDSQPQIASQVLQKLRQYVALKKKLPQSFTENNVRKLYLEIKQSEFQLDEKSSEFFLYLFKSLKMFAESIDLCQNYHTMVKGYDSEQAASASDIRNYYMSDSLMDLPLANSDNHYYQLLEQAVFESDSASPAYLTSMTKAYFKDGSVDHALKFFREGVAKREEMTKKQEDMLVGMYDDTFANQSVSEEAFKEKYLSIMIAREKLKKEVKTANLIERILQRCEAEEVEQIFALQAVLKQERSLLNQIATVSGEDYGVVYDEYDKAKSVENFFKDCGNKNEAALKELKTVKSRKQALQSSIQHKNVEDLISALDIQDGQQVELFGKSLSLDEALAKLGVSPEEYAAYKQYDQKDSLVAQILQDLNVIDDQAESMAKIRLHAFNKMLDQEIDKAVKKNQKEIDEINVPEVPAIDMLEEFEEEFGVDVDEMIDDATLDPEAQADPNDLPYIHEYKDWLKQKPEADYEELVVKEKAYDDFVDENGDILLESVASRREKTLGFAIETFNKIQNKRAPQFYDLNLKPEVTQDNQVQIKVRDTKQIQQSLDNFYYLLHDPTSPIISNFLSLGSDDSNESIMQDSQRLIDLMDQVGQMGEGMESMSFEIQNAVEAQQKAVSQEKYKRQEKVQKMVDQKIKDTYEGFKNTQKALNFDDKAQADSLYPSTLSREQKIEVMKQCLQLEGFKPMQVLDNFYVQDLIVFGMQNKIPEAVRLGENMLGESNQTLPFELAKAVKNYKLSNNAKYQNAIKSTGPINTASVYRSTKDETATLFNRDDPYWQNLIEKNYRRQDHYKVPSAMAWDHKEHGIIGEIIDTKKLERNAGEFGKFI